MNSYNRYPFKEIEKKWQTIWEEKKLYYTDLSNDEKKLYVLVMFIYPSGDRLHIGHWYNYGPTDTWARFKRMQGFNVFEPIGYDAFGLPAENYAIKKGVHPAVSTAENIKKIRQQLKSIGAMYDWSKEINTSSPEYYKWTQWLFLQLYKNGLAYRKKAPVNWCPSCQTVLANEQVIEGKCERCDSEIYRKDLEQWFFKITDYAERLLEGHKKIDWPEKTITMQKNWIGRSEGALVQFKIAEHDLKFEVFTTRPDTLFGVTYMVFAPEHPFIDKITTPEHRDEVQKYIELARKQSEIDRTSTVKEKTGVFTGAFAVNPINGEKIPIWIADYVLMSYGTGAIMAVPAHDQRDFEFAKKYNLPIRVVISPEETQLLDSDLNEAYTGPGIMVNSGEFNNLPSKEGIKKITEYLEEQGIGKYHVTYKLRDWLISRQRYWGAPIPIIYCDKCGEVPVPEEDLPVTLPENVQFTGKGESPLTTAPDFVHTQCPKCGGNARREVDTMDTFVCSSWYFLRYVSPDNKEKPWDRELADKWLPVDQYVGGAEHAVMHLLYARFITKVLHDLDFIGFDEPFQKLTHQGTITNKGAKMSKSRGNVVNPDDFIDMYGSDTFRMYMMFMGDYEEGGDWSDEGITGISRFLNRIWRLVLDYNRFKEKNTEHITIKSLEQRRHYTIKEVTKDLSDFHFNTAISRLMEFYNELQDHIQKIKSGNEQITRTTHECINTLILLLAPFAPHIAEELWSLVGGQFSVFDQKWPEYNEKWLVKDEVTIVIQVNGKLRDQMVVERNSDKEIIFRQAANSEKIQKYISGKEIKKKIYVPNKLVNFVV